MVKGEGSPQPAPQEAQAEQAPMGVVPPTVDTASPFPSVVKNTLRAGRALALAGTLTLGTAGVVHGETKTPSASPDNGDSHTLIVPRAESPQFAFAKMPHIDPALLSQSEIVALGPAEAPQAAETPQQQKITAYMNEVLNPDHIPANLTYGRSEGNEGVRHAAEFQTADGKSARAVYIEGKDGSPLYLAVIVQERGVNVTQGKADPERIGATFDRYFSPLPPEADPNAFREYTHPVSKAPLIENGWDGAGTFEARGIRVARLEKDGTGDWDLMSGRFYAGTPQFETRSAFPN